MKESKIYHHLRCAPVNYEKKECNVHSLMSVPHVALDKARRPFASALVHDSVKLSLDSLILFRSYLKKNCFQLRLPNRLKLQLFIPLATR